MKKILRNMAAGIIMCSLIFLVFSKTINAEMVNESKTTKSTGDVTDEYVAVYTKEDLNNIRNQLDGKYILMNDICFTEEDFSGNGWTPIGKNSENAFTGIFDGNGHYIKGIRITVEGSKCGYWGLFGYNAGTICNVGLVDQRVKTEIVSDKTDVGYNYVGAIAGYSKGDISNCYTSGSIESVIDASYAGAYVGGIVGQSSKAISNCYSSSSVRCSSIKNIHIYAGGIAGQGQAEQCYNIGNIVVSTSDQAYSECAAVASSKNNQNCYSIDDVIRDSSFAKEFTGSVTILAEEQMRKEENFEGFDFTETWEIDADSEYPYPQLKKVVHVEIDENTKEYAGGNGSVYNPYLIRTSDQLNNVRNELGAYYRQIEEIQMTGEDWQPIGKERVVSFYGSYDGNGYTIKGLKMDKETDSCDYVGLFGYSEGTVKNLGVVNGSYKLVVLDHEVVSSKSVSYAGGIAAYNRGIISKCYNTNQIRIIDKIAKGIYDVSAGGISGYSKLVKDCYNSGFVLASGGFPNAAGITAEGKKVLHCYNTGNVQQIDDSTAEAAGISADATVVESYSVPVSEHHSYEDDTVFLDRSQMRDMNCFVGFDFVNTWEMNDNYPYPQLQAVPHIHPEENRIDFSGGNGTRNNPYLIVTKEHLNNVRKYKDANFRLENDIDMNGDNWRTMGLNPNDAFSGTIDGNGYSIKNMNYRAETEEEGYAGFIGYNAGEIMNLSFYNCSFVFEGGEVEKRYQGAICGYNGILSVISNCKIMDSEINVMSGKSDVYVGGITGYNKGNVTDTRLIGSVMTELLGTTKVYTGGIVGYNAQNANVERCYVNGIISGTHNLSERNVAYWGGIAGSNQAAIIDCFCSGDFRITGELKSLADAYLGGIAGFNASKGKIENVYQCADITETYTDTGSIYASGYEDEVRNVYYLDSVTTDLNKGTALDAGEMTNANSFLGFDFDTVWMIDNGEESAYQYPQLQEAPYEGEIKSYLLEECDVESIERLIYTGEEIKPEPKITYNGLQLRKEKDYTLEYANNIECGYGLITVTGKGNYAGKICVSFEIIPRDISGFEAELTKTTYTYNGYAKEPKVSIDGLTKEKDYVVSYSDNVNAGTGKVYIIGEGNYTGIIKKEFKINKADISKKTVNLSYVSCVYTGKEKKPTVKLSGLVLNEHYTVKYKNNKKVGSASVTVTGKGNYKGSVRKTFKINPKETSISNLKALKRGFDVKWKKITVQTTGYQVQYSTSSGFKNKKTVTIGNNKSVSKKVTKLSSGKKYYVRMRTYKTVNGVKYFSKWSAKKSVITK